MKWIPDSYLDLILTKFKGSDGQSICNNQPTTYFQAIKGDVWSQSTSYVVGDVVRQPTPSFFVYECIADGVSGSVEPGWGSSQDQEFNDDSVSWKTHNNYSLAYSDILPSSLIITDDDVDGGRKLTIPEILGVITHMSGTVNHTALVNNITKELTLVTTATTTISGDNDVVSGRTTIFYSFDIDMRDPA